MDAGQGADRPAQPDQDLAPPGRRQRLAQLRADLVAQRLQLARRGGSWCRNRRVVRTAPSGTLAVDTTLRRRTRLSCRLEPPRSATTALLNGQTLEGRRDPQPRLVTRAEHLHLDPLVVAQRREQPLAVAGVADGRGRHRDDAGALAVRRVARKNRRTARSVASMARGAASRARRRPAAWARAPGRGRGAGAGRDPGEQDADGRRAEIDDRHQVRRQTTSADGSFLRGTIDAG